MGKVTMNPDRQYVEKVLSDLKRNNGYCPCKLEHIPDNKCMCLEFRNQSGGMCHCGLYIKA